MPVTVPPAVNYPSPLTAVPSVTGNVPREGQKSIPCEINWGTMGGASSCVTFNLQNNTYLEFSQITALSVDNSNCGADVLFVFPDTSETTLIPAYTPKCIVPIFTNQVQFFVLGEGTQSEDITRFSILNYLPPPIAVPTTQEQEAALVAGVNMTTTGSQQLISASISGTLESVSVAIQSAATTGNTSTITWQLVDGNSNAIATGVQTEGAGSNPLVINFNNNNMRVRFQNGVKVTWTSSVATASANGSFNLYYRTP